MLKPNLIRKFAIVLLFIVMANAFAQNKAEFLTGGDISLLTKVEENGAVFRDGGERRDALEIFKAHGCNMMRLRLWVDPSGEKDQVCDLFYTIKLAQRIKRCGFKLLLDFHYSDTWADPANQHKPKAWQDLNFEQLKQRVYDYSRDSIVAFRAAGAMPDMVQIGNEITPGILWPEGKSYGTPDAFEKLSALLKAGIEGTKAGAGEAKPQIMIHLDCGGDKNKSHWFFDSLKMENVQFDVIGLSYYPVWHGPLAQLKENINNLATRYQKPIIVVEAGYPWQGGNLDDKKQPMAYPATTAGQKQFLQDVITIVRAVPNQLGRGVIWWAPEWIPTKGMGNWSPRTLFDDGGNALPALEAFNIP